MLPCSFERLPLSSSRWEDSPDPHPISAAAHSRIYFTLMLHVALLLWNAAIVQLKMGGQPRSPPPLCCCSFPHLLYINAACCTAPSEGCHCPAQDGRTALTPDPYPPVCCCSYVFLYVTVMLHNALLLWKAAIVQLKIGGQP